MIVNLSIRLPDSIEEGDEEAARNWVAENIPLEDAGESIVSFEPDEDELLRQRLFAALTEVFGTDPDETDLPTLVMYASNLSVSP